MENKKYTMDDILSASFGEGGSKVRAEFKKAINIRQYETETYDLSTELIVERPLTGLERSIISEILLAQLGYTAYADLAFRGLVTASEFETRKKNFVETVNNLLTKAEQLTGKDMGYLLNLASVNL